MDIVERLNAVREGMEAGIDDWPIASQIYEYKTSADEITTLSQRVAELEKERDEYAAEARRQMQHVVTVLAERDALKQQRDGLLAALSIAEPVMDAHAGPSRLADFRAAIASVKEKQNVWKM